MYELCRVGSLSTLNERNAFVEVFFAIKMVKVFKNDNNKNLLSHFFCFKLRKKVKENATASPHSHIYNSHFLKVFDFVLHSH